MFRKLFFICGAICLLFIQLINFSACIKEYSYEKPSLDTLPHEDTIPHDTIVNTFIFPHCSSCEGKDDYIFGTWNFKYDTFFFCGNITRAIIEPEHGAFTFFGPSACSLDSGLIMTVYVDAPLERDTSNVTVHHVIFQYYNNAGTRDVFVSNQLLPFSLTIEEYTAATGIAKGHFSGFVDTDRHTAVEIKDGKFVIQFS